MGKNVAELAKRLTMEPKSLQQLLLSNFVLALPGLVMEMVKQASPPGEVKKKMSAVEEASRILKERRKKQQY